MNPREFLKSYNSSIQSPGNRSDSQTDVIEEYEDYDESSNFSVIPELEEIEDFEDLAEPDNGFSAVVNSMSELDIFEEVSDKNKEESNTVIADEIQKAPEDFMELVDYKFSGLLYEDSVEPPGLKGAFLRFMKRQDYKIVENTVNYVVDTWNSNFETKVVSEDTALKEWLCLSYNLLIEDLDMIKDSDEDFLELISFPYRDISPEEILKLKEVADKPWCDKSIIKNYSFTPDICLMLCSYLERGLDRDLISKYADASYKLDAFLRLSLNNAMNVDTFDCVCNDKANLQVYVDMCLSPTPSDYMFLNKHPHFSEIISMLNRFELAQRSVSLDFLKGYCNNIYLPQILKSVYDNNYDVDYVHRYLDNESIFSEKAANDLANGDIDITLMHALSGNYPVPRMIASLEEMHLNTKTVRDFSKGNSEIQSKFGEYANKVVSAWISGTITENDYLQYCVITLYSNFVDLLDRFMKFPTVYRFNQFAVNCLFIEFTDSCANLPEIGSLVVIDTSTKYSYIGVDSIIADVSAFSEAIRGIIPKDNFKLSLLPNNIGVIVSNKENNRKFSDIHCLKIFSQSASSLENFVSCDFDAIKDLSIDKQLLSIQKFNLVNLIKSVGSYSTTIQLMKMPLSGYLKFDRGIALLNTVFTAYGGIIASQYFAPLYTIFIESINAGVGIKMYYTFVKNLCYRVLKGHIIVNNENLDILSEYAVISLEGSSSINRLNVSEFISKIDTFIQEIRTLGSVRIVTESAHYVQIRKL